MLIDFGEGKTLKDNVKNLSIVGKIHYMAPEIRDIIEKIIEPNYDIEKADVYSLGILFIFCTQLKEFNTYNIQLDNKVKQKIKKFYPQMMNIIYSCISINPMGRPSIKDLYYMILEIKTNFNSNQYMEIHY